MKVINIAQCQIHMHHPVVDGHAYNIYFICHLEGFLSLCLCSILLFCCNFLVDLLAIWRVNSVYLFWCGWGMFPVEHNL